MIDVLVLLGKQTDTEKVFKLSVTVSKTYMWRSLISPVSLAKKSAKRNVVEVFILSRG